MQTANGTRLRQPNAVAASGSKACVRRPVLGASRRSTVRVAAAASPVAGERFDYIIVGGGTAGCVLANRLSADENKRVLVIEAGPAGETFETGVPAALTRLFKHPVLDWGLMAQTQKQLKSREVYLARGRTLGGSSCTNATLYHRGTPSDYDAWGLEGWSSKDLLDWFVNAENYADGPAPYHGQGGTMQTERPRYQNPMNEEFFKSCAAVGLPANPDFNNWSIPQAGFGEFQVTQRKGERADAYRTYLKAAINRGNLKVITKARTTKVHFDKGAQQAQTKAVGVEFSLADNTLGERFTAELAPSGEVLMCAGAVHTPHLLQLSGVGNGTALSEHGIRVVADLPGVGSNLQDHPATLYAARTDDKYDQLAVTSQIYDKKGNVRIPEVLNYLVNRRGPLATTGCDRGAFVSTTGTGEPDLQIRFVCGCALDFDAIQSYIKFAELKRRGLAWPCGITMQLLAIRPKSRGSISLRSTDPYAAPAVELGYLTDAGQKDLATLREGLKISRRIAEAAPLSQYVTEERFPGPNASTDAELDEYVRVSACSGNALVGSCRMGPASDKGAVVSSSDLKVHGFSNLRVVDASVMPVIPGGQTGAPTVMIAERAAALLLGKKPIVGSGSSAASAGRQLVGAA